LIIPQILLGLGGIIGGAFIFVDHVDDLACYLGLPVIVLSLIITPIATELPEKINSVLWARQGKDTLALGNITGALVFQSCIPVAFGVGCTRWNLDNGTILTGIVAVISGTVFMLLLRAKKLTATHLAFGMLAYAIAIGSFVLVDYLDGGLEYLKPGEQAPPAHHGSYEPRQPAQSMSIAHQVRNETAKIFQH
jgi:cation:H+ antiporter